MHIDWLNFTPALSLMGGILIGLAATVLLLSLGRIAGVVGIFAGLFKPVRGDWAWRFAFVFGLLISPVVYGFYFPLPIPSITADWPTILIAGVVVGVGTRLGSGCTSGHGVCGLARFSRRSMVATALFMSSGFATVWLTRHFFN